MDDESLITRKQLVSQKKRTREARKLSEQKIARIGELDPKTGLYFVSRSDGSRTRNGEKIFNAKPEEGEIVRETKPFLAFRSQIDSRNADEESVVSRPVLGEYCPGYANGQIFNCTPARRKPRRQVQLQFVGLARSEGYILIERLGDNVIGGVSLYDLVPGSANWANGIADVTPPISYSDTISLPLSGNSLTYSTEFNTGECLLTFEFECSLDFRIEAQFEAQVELPSTDYNVQIEEQIDSGGWAVVLSKTLASRSNVLPNGLYMLRDGAGFATIAYQQDPGGDVSLPCSSTAPRKYEYRFTYEVTPP